MKKETKTAESLVGVHTHTHIFIKEWKGSNNTVCNNSVLIHIDNSE